jgi:diguanylate cyclase (GGDEF)-like protein
MAARFLLVHGDGALSVRIRSALSESFDVEEFYEAQDERSAGRVLSEKRPDLVLWDLDAGQLDDQTLLLAQHPAADLDPIPVIVVIPAGSEVTKLDLLAKGAADFLTKPFTEIELIARVRMHYRAKVLRDELRAAVAKLETLTVLDELTGLYNRAHLMTILAAECRRFVRYESPVSLVLLEIDQLDRIAGVYGTKKRDDVLRRVSQVAAACVRSTDWVARSSDHELAVVLAHTAVGEAAPVITRLRKEIAELRHPMGGSLHRFTVSIGTAGCDEPSVTPSMLLERAVSALATDRHRAREPTPG